MRAWRFLGPILALGLSSCSSAATVPPRVSDGGDVEQRRAIWADVRQALNEIDFDRADAMEAAFLKSGERTPSGLPKLGEFHVGVQGQFDPPSRENGCIVRDDGLLDRWIAHSPDKPTPYIAKADSMVREAWCIRGTAMAPDVPPQAWEPFKAGLKAAEDFLLAHQSVAARDPEYYVVLVDVYLGLGRGDEEFRTLLDEASSRFPDYHRLYWSAYSYYEPKWFGGPDAIDALARYAAERSEDSEGFGGYARYYWSASAVPCDCWKAAIDWTAMKKGMADVAQRYPDSWNIANFARLSCVMGDGTTARLYFDALGANDPSAAWGGDSEGLATCRKTAGL